MKYLYLLVILAFPLFSQSIYTCNIDGVINFSQSPCGDEDNEITVKVQEPIQSSTEQSTNEPDNSNKTNSQQHFDDISIKLYDRKIKKLELKIKQHQSNLNKKIETLKLKKLYANNNTAGAIYEDSISNEMIAITNKYNIMINQERERIKSYKQKKLELLQKNTLF